MAKSVSESPPSTARTPRISTAPRPVFTVRGTVCSTARLITRANGTFRAAAAHVSRTRSKTTTVSLTE